MAAEPVSSAGDPGQDPAAILEALPEADRADFQRSYAAALDEAKRTYSLRPVEDALEQWRRIAVLARSPRHREAVEHGLRVLAGDDVPLYRVDREALRRGDLPAAWPTM